MPRVLLGAIVGGSLAVSGTAFQGLVDDISRLISSSEMPLAILWTAKKVYPDLFGDIDMRAEVSLFYKTFFNIDLGEKMLNKILGNKGMRHPVS